MLYDFIVVGTGAGGGTLAYRLAQTGKSILILERGSFLPKERENWDPWAVAKGRYRTTERWKDHAGNDIWPYTHYWIGGNTKVYGAALLRMRERDFTEVQHYGGLSPAWPLGYDVFEPYYTLAEQLYSVHGRAGVDPHEPRRSRSFPYDQLPFEPRMAQLADDLRSFGLKPAPVPTGVRLPTDSAKQRASVRLGLFDGYPDPTETKADAQVVGIDAALQYPNVTLVTNARVNRLHTDTSGRIVTQVIASVNGATVEYTAKQIVLACGAINSAALLLRSANANHPRGLANGSDQVGRNLMVHNNGTVVVLMEQENPSEYQKAFLLTDYYYGAEDSALPLGSIQLMGKSDPESIEAEIAQHKLNRTIEDVSRHTVDFFITAEDLPSANNRVGLSSEGQITISYTPNNIEAYERLRAKLIAAMDRVAAKYAHKPNLYMGYKLGSAGVSHQNGTCRFGPDPSSAVLDLNCKAHELDNLYVVDGSFFPSSSAVNPSLTIMANALRVGDHLAAL